MTKLYAITVFFNPAGFKNLLNNYHIFRDSLDKNIELLTVELSFNGQFQIQGENVHRLTSNSIMWQKERLINYGISQLPAEAEYFAWLDCDILFLDQKWVELCLDKLQTCDIIQPFKRVFFCPKGETEFSPFYKFQQSVLWQYKIHKNWLERRKSRELGFAAPGFSFAAKVDKFKGLGLYDRCLTGSGDTFLIDCLLNSESIHGYSDKLTDGMIRDMQEYKEKLIDKQPSVGYIPVDILHLYHGTVSNRNYIPRHEILRKYDFDPKTDVRLENNVFEWGSDKVGMHEDIKRYFFDRKEDE